MPSDGAAKASGNPYPKRLDKSGTRTHTLYMSNLTHHIVDLAGNPISSPMSRLNLPATITMKIPGTLVMGAWLIRTATLNLDTNMYETTIDGSWFGLEGFDAIVPVAMVEAISKPKRNSVRGLIAALA